MGSRFGAGGASGSSAGRRVEPLLANQDCHRTPAQTRSSQIRVRPATLAATLSAASAGARAAVSARLASAAGLPQCHGCDRARLRRRGTAARPCGLHAALCFWSDRRGRPASGFAWIRQSRRQAPGRDRRVCPSHAKARARSSRRSSWPCVGNLPSLAVVSWPLLQRRSGHSRCVLTHSFTLRNAGRPGGRELLVC
jgi:hypothetical protein